MDKCDSITHFEATNRNFYFVTELKKIYVISQKNPDKLLTSSDLVFNDDIEGKIHFLNSKQFIIKATDDEVEHYDLVGSRIRLD